MLSLRFHYINSASLISLSFFQRLSSKVEYFLLTDNLRFFLQKNKSRFLVLKECYSRNSSSHFNTFLWSDKNDEIMAVKFNFNTLIKNNKITNLEHLDSRLIQLINMRSITDLLFKISQIINFMEMRSEK